MVESIGSLQNPNARSSVLKYIRILCGERVTCPWGIMGGLKVSV